MENKLAPFIYRTFPDWFQPVIELALDLRWTWNHGSDDLWKKLDADAWNMTQNPWWMLQIVSRDRIEKLAGDNAFRSRLADLIESRREYVTRSAWFKGRFAEGEINPIAFFSMEYALGEALPLYAGGLGVLAGDYLKTASDMAVPIIGLGLLYQEGYLRQIINSEGWQIEAFPHNDPTNIPISPVTDSSGGWLRVPLELPGRMVLLRVWEAHVGRVKLYLLDSNDPMNNAADRSLIYRLYDDRHEFRLLQEMVIGICGWRVVRALGLPAEICH
jgi:glycogen phosphorylase